MQEGYHLSGGTLILAFVTKQQCLDACLMQSQCLAVDYDKIAQTCYAFGSDTYCKLLERLDDVTHYTRVPCIEGD